MKKKMKTMLTMLISSLLLTAALSVSVYAAKSEDTSGTEQMTKTNWSEIEVKEQIREALREFKANAQNEETQTASGFSMIAEPELATETLADVLPMPSLKSGTYTKWADRVSFSSVGTSFYNELKKGADNNGSNDFLIDPTKGTYVSNVALPYLDSNENEVMGTGTSLGITEISYRSSNEEDLIEGFYNEYYEVYAELFLAYETFNVDCPEVFWLSGDFSVVIPQVYITELNNGFYRLEGNINVVLTQYDKNGKKIFDIRHSAYQDVNKIKAGINELNLLSTAVVDRVKNQSTSEKLKYFNWYLTMKNELNAYYDSSEAYAKLFDTNPDCFNCLSALRGTVGKTAPTDLAYIYAFQVLCNKAKIPSTIVGGQIGLLNDKVKGYWNIAQINNNWYAINSAWNDFSSTLGKAVSGEESEMFLLTGMNTPVVIDGQEILFGLSHSEQNIVASGFEYKNGPKLAAQEYVHPIKGINLSATATDYMYGYEDAPVITAEAVASAGQAGTPTYAWVLVAPNGQETVISSANTSITFPEVTEPGVYRVRSVVALNGEIKSAEIEIEVTIFKDIKESDWFYNAIDWSIENGVTYGLNNSSFGPSVSCTRAQIVTFLWRAAGSPAPVNTTNNFKDVKTTDYFYKATLWAVENKILSGYTADMFAPNVACTRAEMVTFLWRNAGRTEVEDKVHPFKDVTANGFYYNAMLWAVEEGIAKGYTATMFAPGMTVTRAETVTFLYRADGHANPPEKNDGPSKLLDTKEACDETGILSYIENAYVESGVMQELLIYENHLLVWGNGVNEENKPAVKLAILDMTTGEPIQETSLTGIELPEVQVCDETIAVVDWATGNVWLLDGGLQILKEIKGTTTYCATYVSEDAKKIYTITPKTGVIVKEVTNENTKVLLENALSLYAGERSGNMVSISYVDKTTQMNVNAVLDLATGEILTLPLEGSFYNVLYQNGIWSAVSYDDNETYYIATENQVYTYTPSEEVAVFRMICAANRFMTESNDAEDLSALSLYHLDGAFVSTCNIPIEGAGFFGEPVWLEKDGGYYLLLADPKGNDVLMFWDMSIAVEGEDLSFEEFAEEKTEGSVVSKELYDKANALSETYGIQIKIAELAMTEKDNYSLEQMLDEEAISNALDLVETALSNYPDNFFAQLRYGAQRTLELHLAGKITSYDEESDSYTTVGGFASSLGSKNIMAVTVSESDTEFTKALYHEMMHLIDYKLAFDAELRENALYSEEGWDALNPEDFTYAEDYETLPDGYYNDGYTAWFIDAYARTNAKEDRARIMEYAMIGDNDTFENHEGRLEKLEYLCTCIRDAFDTTGWPEVTAWEALLK